MRLQVNVGRPGGGEGGGQECRRFPQRDGWRGGGVGVREDHEPALLPAALAATRPHMQTNMETH